MEQVARAVAGGPRLLLRALLVCFFAALWLLLGHVAAEADGLDAPGQVAGSVSDTVGSAPDTVDDAVPADEPVAAVEHVVRRTSEKVDDTTEKVRSAVQDTTRQVTEVVETVETPAPVAPGPAPSRPTPAPAAEAPARDGVDTGDTGGPVRSLNADDTRGSLVTQEDPALLVVPDSPVVDLAGAASAVSEAAAADLLSSPVPAQLPSPGTVGGEVAPGPGGSAQPGPASAHAAQLDGAVVAPVHVLVTGAPTRALVAPADRATSPGTTPD